jgi:hypothetical protein
MRRWHWIPVATAAGILALSACRLGTTKTPSLTVSPRQVTVGTAVRASGQNWRPGERLTIALAAPDAATQNSRPVTTALTDASGSFVALFSFPQDAAGPAGAEVWLLAYSTDLKRVARASLAIEAAATPTAPPTLGPSRTLTSPAPTGTATSAPTPTRPALVWRGQYFGNTTLSGSPALERDDPAIDFQWGEAAPVDRLTADSFAVRWTGEWTFETGGYRFYAALDDGVRLWLDEHLIIDQWHEDSAASYSASAFLSAGSHALRVEYFNGRGPASVKVWWEYSGPQAEQTYAEWKGEYFGNTALSGTPFLIVGDRLPDFNWGAGAPAAGMPADSFSIRWTTSMSLETGTYHFHVRCDDGVRLWVDDRPMIDHWQDGAADTYGGEIILARGSHSVRLEYYEHTGQALIQLRWELVLATPTPTISPTPATPTPSHTPVLPTFTPSATATRTNLLPTATPTAQETPPLPVVVATPTSVLGAGHAPSVYLPWVSAAMGMARAPAFDSRRHIGGPQSD